MAIHVSVSEVKRKMKRKEKMREKPSIYTQGAKRVDLRSTLTKHLNARLPSLFQFLTQRTLELLIYWNLG